MSLFHQLFPNFLFIKRKHSRVTKKEKSNAMQTGSKIICGTRSDVVAAFFNNISVSYFKCNLQRKKTLRLWDGVGGISLLMKTSFLIFYLLLA